MTDSATHPSNSVEIEGAVFEGLHEGLLRRHTAAEWLGIYDASARAGVAIRRARDGEDGASFRAPGGVVWHLRRVESGEG